MPMTSYPTEDMKCMSVHIYISPATTDSICI